VYRLNEFNLNIFSFFSNRRSRINVRNKWTLYKSGWDPNKKNVILIHGFNGAENNKIVVILRNGNILKICARFN